MSQSLKSSALKVLLTTTIYDLLDDQESTELLLSFFREHLFERCLQSTGLYHVYSANDGFWQNMANNTKLLKSFSTELDAVQWILDSGSHFIREFNHAHGENMLLTIIYNNNTPLDELHKRNSSHPIFACTPKTYKHALKRHWCRMEEDSEECNPYWITYIKDDGTIVRGCTKELIEMIHKRYRYSGDDAVNTEQKNEDWLDYHEAQTDGKAWVIKKRQQELKRNGECAYSYY
jgi:hypothetical protein